MAVEDFDQEIRKGMIDVLCWSFLRYYGVVNGSYIAVELKKLGLNISRQSFNQAFRRLQRLGLVELVRSENDDGRLRSYRLTVAGDCFLEGQFIRAQQILGIAGWFMNRVWPHPPEQIGNNVSKFAGDTPRLDRVKILRNKKSA
jgi:hypothetical protein